MIKIVFACLPLQRFEWRSNKIVFFFMLVVKVNAQYEWIICYCCCAYFSSCPRTASDANKYWMIRTLFIAITTSWLEGAASVHLLTSLQCSNVPVDFKFLATKFALCFKPPSTDNHRKASCPRAQQRDHNAIRVVVKTTPWPFHPRHLFVSLHMFTTLT